MNSLTRSDRERVVIGDENAFWPRFRSDRDDFIVVNVVYPLSEAPDALRHLGEGRVQGKVVITM